ncbi:MAG TPA: phosphotransferase [Propionicimonas sp.]|nr:phosphotransferase [Propionicimonas sp.]
MTSDAAAAARWTVAELDEAPAPLPDLPHTRFEDVTVPAVITELAAGRAIRPIWRNEIGGVTFQLDGGAEYVKYGPPHPEFRPDDEWARLTWVGQFVNAPKPIDHGADASGNHWLRTAGLAGTSAVLDGWRSRAEQVVPELGRALRHFHDVVPVAECPWVWSVEDRLADRRGGLSTEHGAESSALTQCIPPLDAVVCHGDACNPNFLLDPAGQCVGYVDLGQLGTADRWADLAPALMSLTWNFGDGWRAAFLAGYGIALDAEKLDFYTRLWNTE